jgi:hypothetical protein
VWARSETTIHAHESARSRSAAWAYMMRCVQWPPYETRGEARLLAENNREESLNFFCICSLKSTCWYRVGLLERPREQPPTPDGVACGGFTGRKVEGSETDRYFFRYDDASHATATFYALSWCICVSARASSLRTYLIFLSPSPSPSTTFRAIRSIPPSQHRGLID